MSTREIHVHAAGTMLPGPPIDIPMLAKLFGMTETWEQWVTTFVGTQTRHLSIDLGTGEVRYTLADLAETAARRALAAAELAPEAVDVMVMSTSTPDQLMPATVNVVADRLGIDRIPTYQLQSGCSGAVQALDVARHLLLGGRHTTALVIGGDTLTKHADLSLSLGQLAPAQLVGVVMFGDGAGAAVLSTEPGPGSAVLRQSHVELTGLNREPGHIVEWFGLRDRHDDVTGGAEDYKAIEALVPKMAVETLHTLLDDLDWLESDIDYLLPPQLSGRMTANIVQQLGVTQAEEISCVVETANTGNALPFFQLERLLPRMVSGERAIGIAIESSKWIESGFALERP